MYIILGGTGRVGSATAQTLLAKRQPVTIVTRSASKGELWKQRGAEVAVIDAHDVDALRAVFRRGRRAFLLIIARERWEETFRSLGFSEKAARSYTCMTGLTVDGLALPVSPIRGDIPLTDYVSEAARKKL